MILLLSKMYNGMTGMYQWELAGVHRDIRAFLLQLSVPLGIVLHKWTNMNRLANEGGRGW